MPLRYGRPMVAIPGPSIMPDRVLAAMASAMPDIYGREILAVSNEVFDRLPAMARTSGQAFLSISSGHGAWELALANTLSPGDRILVLESGRFAPLWGEAADFAGIDVHELPAGANGAIDLEATAAALHADSDHELVAVLCVHTDTATSVRNDIPALRATLDAAGHPALLMVDCIASMGCERFEMDAWGVDLAVGASQKGLMTPPGLGIVWVNDRAYQRVEQSGLGSSYFDWKRRGEATKIYERFSGTPPVSHLYGMREALRMIDEEGGLDAVWARHQVLADAVRAAVMAWSTPEGLNLWITDPSKQSNAVTAVHTGIVNARALAARCEKAGLTVGLGIIEPRHSFRIAHMGHLNPPMILGTLATIEGALRSLSAPLAGSGVEAAAAVVGEALRNRPPSGAM